MIYVVKSEKSFTAIVSLIFRASFRDREEASESSSFISQEETSPHREISTALSTGHKAGSRIQAIF